MNVAVELGECEPEDWRDLFSDLGCSAMVKREEGLNKECVERDKDRDKALVRQLTC